MSLPDKAREWVPGGQMVRFLAHHMWMSHSVQHTVGRLLPSLAHGLVQTPLPGLPMYLTFRFPIALSGTATLHVKKQPPAHPQTTSTNIILDTQNSLVFVKFLCYLLTTHNIYLTLFLDMLTRCSFLCLDYIDVSSLSFPFPLLLELLAQWPSNMQALSDSPAKISSLLVPQTFFYFSIW